ncbi:hypothetical protein HBI70_187900 [Parastagonospora nodorum]|nr:hypothetical protein HBH53_213030 [Parastagonospora nodorum]KAH4183845.1 hypothetical protein HBH42_199810 [Parastagonospora nodorum]KAH4269121.1 hypothetical protein HBI03_053120 [Parastagonospora nodorum]KAH4280442.1 hypothetical protein HBI04_060770 [Parastagonospora nodorum]KAH4600386.1 hypothetical protein HBH82_190720 [Parastagonospora nodorum]
MTAPFWGNPRLWHANGEPDYPNFQSPRLIAAAKRKGSCGQRFQVDGPTARPLIS